ncbi:hypothetical protein B0H14DRAFT_3485070 [Mycena olivaceomarginata]|nr:hypothetical protein B0H14DRAFT_3485070 [Mycena olivaceomarginata]
MFDLGNAQKTFIAKTPSNTRSLNAHARGLNAVLDSTSHLRPINGALAPRVSPCAPPTVHPLRPHLCHIARRQRLSLALLARAFRLRVRVHIRATTRAQVPAGFARAARPLRLDVPRLASPPRIDARSVDVRAAPAQPMESTQLAASAPSAGATEWGAPFSARRRLERSRRAPCTHGMPLDPALLTLPKWKAMLDKVCAQDPAESGSGEPGEVLGAALVPWEREQEVEKEATEMEGVLPRSEEKEKEGHGEFTDSVNCLRLLLVALYPLRPRAGPLFVFACLMSSLWRASTTWGSVTHCDGCSDGGAPCAERMVVEPAEHWAGGMRAGVCQVAIVDEYYDFAVMLPQNRLCTVLGGRMDVIRTPRSRAGIRRAAIVLDDDDLGGISPKSNFFTLVGVDHTYPILPRDAASLRILPTSPDPRRSRHAATLRRRRSHPHNRIFLLSRPTPCYRPHQQISPSQRSVTPSSRLTHLVSSQQPSRAASQLDSQPTRLIASPSYFHSRVSSPRPFACSYCSDPTHFTVCCPIVAVDIHAGIWKRNVDGRVVLPCGMFAPHRIVGQDLCARISTWHASNSTHRTCFTALQHPFDLTLSLRAAALPVLECQLAALRARAFALGPSELQPSQLLEIGNPAQAREMAEVLTKS